MTTGFDRMWAELAPIGRDGTTGGYRRFAWTRTDHDLREWFVGECAARGLALAEDRAGNQWGWWGDPDAAPGVVIGSHLDSVPDGGAFDGPLGVVSALATVDALRAAGVTPPAPDRSGELRRRGGGAFRHRLRRLPDHHRCSRRGPRPGPPRCRRHDDGRGLARRRPRPRSSAPTPRRCAACTPSWSCTSSRARRSRWPPTARRTSSTRRAVAIGTDIWPHGRWRIELPGEANHAGTTRLEDRRDAMLSLATVVQQTRSYAAGLGCVATVGKVRVEPGGVNAIPSRVTAWLDARGADERAVRATVSGVLASARRLGGSHEQESWTETTRFDQDLLTQLSGILPEAPPLGTGAGHDAGILATHGIPAAMLFVRNPTGISHSPAEHAEPDDCHHGVAALTAVASALCQSDTPMSETRTKDLT